MLTTNQTVLGSIITSKNGSLINYSISCFLEKPSRINCVLLDKQGATLWEQSNWQPEGQSKLDLQLPPLRQGEYNCWIEMNESMHLRTLQVTTDQRGGLLGQLIKRFS
jgi:hypothetical protein